MTPTKKPPRNNPILRLRSGPRHTLDFSHFFDNNVAALITTRAVDFKLKSNQIVLTAGQKNFLRAAVNEPIEIFPVARQVHGKRIVILKRPSCLTSFMGKADGFITARVDIPLMVRTADCLSIFLYDPEHRVISLVHAGWKGSQKNIAANAVLSMKKNFRTKPKDLRIVFGPAIQSCCYEVGQEFQKIFPNETVPKGNRFFLDLSLVNLRQLRAAGVLPKNVWDCGLCTICETNLFSYRREGNKAGRMVSLMMLKAVP